MAEIMETLMLICFGLSWPLNILKSYRARSAKGKSISFVILIFSGYICGIVSKLLLMKNGFSVNPWVVAVYTLNAAMVFVDFVLYFRNKKLDLEREHTIS